MEYLATLALTYGVFAIAIGVGRLDSVGGYLLCFVGAALLGAYNGHVGSRR